MNCQRIETLLIDYCENTLEQNQKEEVTIHLNSCMSCQASHTEIIVLLHSLQDLKKEPTEDPGEAYFSTLLQRTRHRIEENKSQPLLKRFFSFFSVPTLAFSVALGTILVVLAVNQIEDLSLFQQKNIYGALAKELIKMDDPDAPLDADSIWDDIHELNDQQLKELLQNLDETSLEAAQGAS